MDKIVFFQNTDNCKDLNDDVITAGVGRVLSCGM